MSESTIAAISTGPIAAGIAVIRISGEESIKIADRIFVSYKGKTVKSMQGYSCAYGYIKDEKEEKTDDVVLTLFKAPNSYTGEDVVEISCHGGVYITKKILEIILSNGAKLALPGEFTKRAFLNNKMDLTKSEAVIDLINASSEKSARFAKNMYSGKLYQKIKVIINEISDLCSHLEAWADYPDEDIETVNKDQLKSRLSDIENMLFELIKNYDNGKIIKDGINTTIIGKANVGKSTLMNWLAGFERSIVTDIPGTTRDTVEESIVIDDIRLNIADTAGIRDSEDVVEQIGVKRALEKLTQADLVLALFDHSLPLSKKDYDVIKSIKDIGNTPVIAIINKTDLNKELDCDFIENNFDKVVYISAQRETGFEDFKKALFSVFDLSFAENADFIMLNERQKQAVINSYRNVENAAETLEMDLTFDAVTVCLEEAVSELLELTGERVSDVIVDRIFSRFCVGK